MFLLLLLVKLKKKLFVVSIKLISISCSKFEMTKCLKVSLLACIMFQVSLYLRKNIFTCLVGVHNKLSLSRHEQVCFMRLLFR